MLDPLEYRAKTSLPLPGMPPEITFGVHSLYTIPKSIRAYLLELEVLSKMRKPDGKMMFHGLGLYPEGGPDLLPIVVTRNHGRLVGMSLHEGEVIVGARLLRTTGYKPKDVLGDFINDSQIQRDAAPHGLSLGDNQTVVIRQKRMSLASDVIGRRIGSTDWMTHGRLINWEHFTFLPSASRDTRILDNFLGGRRFDYILLKGTFEYGFKGTSEADARQYGQWIRTLEKRYAADGAAFLVSAWDNRATKILSGLGYHAIRHGSEAEYAQDQIKYMPLSDLDESDRVAGVRLVRTEERPDFLSIGRFTVMCRRKKRGGYNATTIGH